MFLKNKLNKRIKELKQDIIESKAVLYSLPARPVIGSLDSCQKQTYEKRLKYSEEKLEIVKILREAL